MKKPSYAALKGTQRFDRSRCQIGRDTGKIDFWEEIVGMRDAPDKQPSHETSWKERERRSQRSKALLAKKI